MPWRPSPASWEAKQKVAVTSFGVSLLQEDVMQHDQCLHSVALAI